MKCKCKLCKWEWTARTKNQKPKACPACKRYDWDKKGK